MISRQGFLRILLPTLCLALALAGCRGDGGGRDNDTNDTARADSGQTLAQVLSEPLGAETSCPNLALSQTSGVPGDEITISGLPSEMGAISLRVIAENDDGETVVDPLFVRIDDDTGAITFSAPTHPTGNPEGGAVQLEPGDGERHCPRQTFTVQPLPPAPADYPVTVAEDLERWVDDVIETMGYDPQTLLETSPDSLPEARLSLWLAKQFVSSDRDDALPALARQARDNNDEMLARLLMASGLEQAIEQAIMELNMTPEGRLEPRSMTQASRMLVREDASGIASGIVSGGAQNSPPKANQSFSPSASCEEQAFDPDELQINTAAELSNRMQSAGDGALLGGEATTRTGQALGGFSLADSGAGGTMSGYLGTGVTVATSVEAAKRALEPQRITEFRVENVQQEWVEDRPSNDLLFWDGATVRAEGNEFNLGEATLQGLVAFLGMTPGPLGTATTAATTVSPGAVNDVIADLTGDSCVRIRAPEYGPIDVDDSQWTESEIVGSTVELAGDGHTEYRGVDIGASTLEIDLKAEPFALVAPMTDSYIIDVIQVNTSRIPSSVNVSEPGEQVELSVTATNPYVDDNRDNYSAALPEGKGTIVKQGGNGDEYTVTYATPQAREDYPTHVEFTANHSTLPKSRGPRIYQVEVDIGGDVSINERNACLNPGDSMTFTATLEGFADDNQSVSWQASAGSISSTGAQMANYQAPGSPVSEVEITATAESDGSVTDTVTVNVSNNCIEKRWFPSARIALDGNGTYRANVTCPNQPGDNDPVQEEKIEPIDPPGTDEISDPGDYWFDRTRDMSANFQHNSTRYFDDEDSGQCLQASFSGSSDGSIEYIAQGDGTLAASFDSALTIDCIDYGNGVVACVDGAGGMALNGAFYLDLTERRRYTLEGELSCSALEGDVGIGLATVGLTADVVRYDASGEPVATPGSTGVENPNGTLRSGRLYEIACDQANQVVPINVDFVLTAPPDGQTHRVVINLTGGLGIAPDVDDTESFGPPSTTAPPMGPGDIETGSHTSNAEIDFSVRLSPN